MKAPPHVIRIALGAVASLLLFYVYLKTTLTLDIDGRSIGARSFGEDDGVTIRVNTFRRLDLLELFLDYYLGSDKEGGRKKECSLVKQVQVVWSDPANQPPTSWVKEYGERLVFEVHDEDTLSNRFLPKTAIETDAVFSVDDDLIIPCATLAENLRTWRSFDETLVGFSPRMYAYDVYSGAVKYLKWQHTWWSGMYAIMLTKASFLHRDYLDEFRENVPAEFLEHIKTNRNCEDIAMAHIVASKSRSAPMWVGGEIYEVGEQGISSGSSHFNDRGKCLQMLQSMTATFPWVTGYSKMMPLSRLQDLWYLGA